MENAGREVASAAVRLAGGTLRPPRGGRLRPRATTGGTGSSRPGTSRRGGWASPCCGSSRTPTSTSRPPRTSGGSRPRASACGRGRGRRRRESSPGPTWRSTRSSGRGSAELPQGEHADAIAVSGRRPLRRGRRRSLRGRRRHGCGRGSGGPRRSHGDVRRGEGRRGAPARRDARRRGRGRRHRVPAATSSRAPSGSSRTTTSPAGSRSATPTPTSAPPGTRVVIGGSRAMTGAVGLMAGGAYRAGAGLVAAAVPGSILPVVQGAIREAVFAPLPETDAGTAAGTSERLEEILAQADALAIGPGMTTDERTAAWIRELVRSCEIPVVLDADGLNAFAGRADELADRKSDLVAHARTPASSRRLSGLDGASDRRRPGRPRARAGRAHAVGGAPQGLANAGRRSRRLGPGERHRRVRPRDRRHRRRADGHDRRAARPRARAGRRGLGRGAFVHGVAGHARRRGRRRGDHGRRRPRPASPRRSRRWRERERGSARRSSRSTSTRSVTTCGCSGPSARS